MRGQVSPRCRARGKLLLRGWAGDAEGGLPGETVVAFLDGRFAGYSTLRGADGGPRAPRSRRLACATPASACG